MKYFFSVVGGFYFSLIVLSCFAKVQSPYDSLKQFTIDSNIIQDNSINELILKHILINETKKGKVKGYRVQIHFGIEKTTSLAVESKFTTEYPDVPVYLNYQQPYFKIRVGDFRTKLEAYKLMREISDFFPGSFIVSDEIECPVL